MTTEDSRNKETFDFRFFERRAHGEIVAIFEYECGGVKQDYCPFSRDECDQATKGPNAHLIRQVLKNWGKDDWAKGRRLQVA